MSKKGRPTKYNEEIALEICERISNGEPLEDICRDDHMPCSTTVHIWKADKEDPEKKAFSEDFARARRVGHDVIAQNARKTARGDEGYTTGDVQRDKLVVDTDLKLLAKWDKRYSDKIAHVGGSEDDAPIATEVVKRIIVDGNPTDTDS